jgi:membrane-associated phospholipid phosphatase
VKTFRSRLLPLCGMLSILIIDLFYLVLNHPTSDVHSLVTDLDRHTPFLKIFILPYMSWQAFLFITLTYLCFKDLRTYYRTLIAIDVSLLICDMIFFLYQTTVPRPVLVGDDMLTHLVRTLYRSDNPYNCFPSIHVLTSWILLKAIHMSPKRNVWNRTIISSIAITIIFSTLFIKQHVILDAVAGITIGGLVFTLVYRYEQVQLWGRQFITKAFAKENQHVVAKFSNEPFSNEPYRLVKPEVEGVKKASKKIS